MLLPVLGRDETERRVLINTIGPVWDGNEVWLLVAGGATFAAFPEWYATLFSGFYLPLLLILVALIVRGVAFEYRGKRRRRPRGGAAGTAAIFVGSRVPALLWGVAFANIVRGVPLDADQEFIGDVLHPAQPVRAARRADHAGAVHPHGAVFLALKTDGDVRERAERAGAAVGAGRGRRRRRFLLWTQLARRRRAGLGAGRCWPRVGPGRRRRRRAGAAARAGRSSAPAATHRRSRWPACSPRSSRT